MKKESIVLSTYWYLSFANFSNSRIQPRYSPLIRTKGPPACTRMWSFCFPGNLAVCALTCSSIQHVILRENMNGMTQCDTYLQTHACTYTSVPRLVVGSSVKRCRFVVVGSSVKQVYRYACRRAGRQDGDTHKQIHVMN